MTETEEAFGRDCRRAGPRRAIAALFDNNLMFEIQGDDGVLPWIGRKTGRRAIADIIRDVRALTEPISFEIEDILASESRAAIVGALRTAQFSDPTVDGTAGNPGGRAVALTPP